MQDNMGERMAELMMKLTKLENDYESQASKKMGDSDEKRLNKAKLDFVKSIDKYGNKLLFWKGKAHRLTMEKQELMDINFVGFVA